MAGLFIKLLNISITASYVALAVFLLRFAFKKAPRWISCLLWGLVAFRLLCPFSFESVLSLIPRDSVVSLPSISAPADTQQGIVNGTVPETQSPPAASPDASVPPDNNTVINKDTDSVNKEELLLTVLGMAWAVGTLIMLLYAVISYIRLRLKVREAVKDGGVWLSDRVSTPFVLGTLAPRIYMPADMAEEDKRYIYAHERAHIKRFDHLWKPLGFLLLSVHWFNPVMWAAYYLLCRDIECACDEKVIKEHGEGCKVGYSTALINCSVSRRSISACPLAFGETAAKERVKGVLNYKKPAFWIIAVALVACAVTAIFLLTDKPEESPKNNENSEESTEITESTEVSELESGDDIKIMYTGLPIDKGLTVYVTHGERFALLPTREEPYTTMELYEKFGKSSFVGAWEMKEILATYDIDDSMISLTWYQDPTSSLLLPITEEYMAGIRKLLDLTPVPYRPSGAVYVDMFGSGWNNDVFDAQAEKNKTIEPAEGNKIAVVEINGVDELIPLLGDYGSEALKAEYNEEFFKEKSLLVMDLTFGSSGRYVFMDEVIVDGSHIYLNLSFDTDDTFLSSVVCDYVCIKEIQKSVLEGLGEYSVTIAPARSEEEKDKIFTVKGASWGLVEYMGELNIEKSFFPYPEMSRPFYSTVFTTASIQSAEELDALFAQATLGHTLVDLSKYNDEFFENNHLLAIPYDFKQERYIASIDVYEHNGLYIELHELPDYTIDSMITYPAKTVLLVKIPKAEVNELVRVLTYCAAS